MSLMQTVDFAGLNWMDVERYLQLDTRVVIPLGATEEHGYLSLLTDTLFVNEVSRQACSRANVLIAPTLPFGCSAFSINYPGTISLRTATLCAVLEDMVDCLYRQGFRRIVVVTGHGGNEVVTGVLSEVQLDRTGLNIYYKSAWAGMAEAVHAIEAKLDVARGEHASWYEVFPFSRVAEIPEGAKPWPETPDFPMFPLNPRTARTYLGDGVVRGQYKPPDSEVPSALLQMCVDALAEFLAGLPPQPASS